MQTHPCFPLTPNNEAEYRRLNEAKSLLETTTDPLERIKLITERGRASQAIRQIKQKESMNQIVPLNLPKPPDTEIARLRSIIDEQREQLRLVRDRNTELTQALVSLGYMTPPEESTSRQRVAAMAATLQANKQPLDATDQAWAQQKAQELGYTEALQEMKGAL